MAISIDAPTQITRGVNTALALQAPTVQGNLANVPGLRQRIDYFQQLMQQPLNEQEIGDYFNQQNAMANLRGQAASPAAILQNVVGLEALKRGVRTQAAGDLGQATGFMQLNPYQPSQGASDLLQNEQFNAQMAMQEAQMNAQKSAEKKAAIGSLLGAGLAFAAPFAIPALGGMVGVGAGAGGLGGLAGAAGGGGIVPRALNFLTGKGTQDAGAAKRQGFANLLQFGNVGATLGGNLGRVL